MKVIKRKRVANWLGSPVRVIQQLIVSCWSYLSFPFSKFHDNAAKIYFMNLYAGKPDPLIFDGKDSRYFEQIEMVYDIRNLAKKNVLDLGCGNGALFLWLENKRAFPKEYVGIDFAHPPSNFGDKAYSVQKDLRELQIGETNADVVIAVNVLCYLNNYTMDFMFEPTKSGTELIIVEPSPSVFWDAHFDGVELYYRNHLKLTEYLKSKGWQVKRESIDYGFKFIGKYFFSLSFCLFLVSDTCKKSLSM